MYMHQTGILTRCSVPLSQSEHGIMGRLKSGHMVHEAKLFETKWSSKADCIDGLQLMQAALAVTDTTCCTALLAQTSATISCANLVCEFMIV